MVNLKDAKDVKTSTSNDARINKTKDSKFSNSKPQKNSKQKVVIPTLRETQRYVVYKLILNDKLNGNLIVVNDFDKIHNDIISKCNSLLGIFESAKAGLMSAKYDTKKLSGVIRVDSKYVDKLKICLGMV
ncbi:MAG TPA: hypothetical protein V6C58_12505, partial [Allocoleopsis sp.]